MAFGGSLYGSFTTNCLDDIPFKLGPKFKPPTKVVLPSEFHISSQSSALKEEYTFEVEEAVLKWSAEREKQLAEQRRLEQEIAESVKNDVSSEQVVEQTDPAPSEPLYGNQDSATQPLYENPGILLPQPAPRPKVRPKPKDEYVNILVPNPLIANISNDILKPVPSSSPSESSDIVNSDSKPTTKSNDLDLTWFEKVDDPFDNLELQTINDMEELASVLEETKKNSPEPASVQDESSAINEANGDQIENSVDGPDGDEDIPNYENVELKMVNLKGGSNEIIYDNNKGTGLSSLTDLPPVPPRRDLVGRTPPLPPIGQSYSDPVFSQTVNQSLDEKNGHVQNFESSNSIDASFQKEESATKVISKRRVALPKPPRTYTYSRHELNDNENECTDDSNYENNQPTVSIDSVGTNMNVQFTNSNQNLQSKTSSNECLNFVNHHFGKEEASGTNGQVRPQPAPRKPVPPPRPTTQPWNRYSPLPPTPRSASDQPAVVSLPARTSPDLYSQLSTEAQGCVDKLATMGFQKERLARAVQNIGHDEKEVVEYLCLVDQLIEKGYNTYLAENALLMFHNSMKKASDYLELFTQMQELGFNGDKIKEALVNTDNDREKALDILTASS